MSDSAYSWHKTAKANKKSYLTANKQYYHTQKGSAITFHWHDCICQDNLIQLRQKQKCIKIFLARKYMGSIHWNTISVRRLHLSDRFRLLQPRKKNGRTLLTASTNAKGWFHAWSVQTLQTRTKVVKGEGEIKGTHWSANNWGLWSNYSLIISEAYSSVEMRAELLNRDSQRITWPFKAWLFHIKADLALHIEGRQTAQILDLTGT